MCVQTAYASHSNTAAALAPASLARYNAATFPEANMQSTSALLNSSAPQMSYKQSSTRRMNPGAQMSFRALRTTSAAQVHTIGAQGGVSAGSLSSGSSTGRTYSASSSGTAGMATISLPALSISDKNLASAARAFTGDDEDDRFAGATLTVRRNGRDEPDDPADPPGMDTPVGATPWLLFVLLSGIYVAFRLRSRRNQSAKS